MPAGLAIACSHQVSSDTSGWLHGATPVACAEEASLLRGRLRATLQISGYLSRHAGGIGLRVCDVVSEPARAGR
jgi:hypothetical protein